MKKKKEEGGGGNGAFLSLGNMQRYVLVLFRFLPTVFLNRSGKKKLRLL